MGLTVANTTTGSYARSVGNEYETRKTIAFDSSYPTGGEAITAADLGFSVFPTDVRIEPAAGFVFEMDYANKKILAYWVDTTVDGAALAQVPDTTDLSAVTGVRVVSRGKYLK